MSDSTKKPSPKPNLRCPFCTRRLSSIILERGFSDPNRPRRQITTIERGPLRVTLHSIQAMGHCTRHGVTRTAFWDVIAVDSAEPWVIPTDSHLLN